jgi:serine/threonine protein kinase
MNTSKKKKGRSKNGGEVLASGGFGCIFKPAIKCKNKSKRTEGVSKMSVAKYGKQEMSEIKKIKAKLNHIQNYEKYYLLDVELCYPDKLTKSDMINFDKKCFALSRYNISEKNVNSKLNELTILNMPDGGVDLKDWLVVDGKITIDKIQLLNKIIVKLLKYGVKPMNNAGVIHNDLKDRNIIIDKEMNTRIIDWGLAGVVVNKSIPFEILNRPLQFNTPFSSMIISDEFKLNYDIFLQRVKDGIMLFDTNNVRNFIINEYLIKMSRYYGYSDDNVMLFKMIFSPGIINNDAFLSHDKRDALIEYGYYLYYLTNYITDILMTYTDTESYYFDLNKYFYEVYLHNSDVFGLMTIYYNFFELELSNIEMDDEKKKIYLNHIRSILVEYLFSNGGEKIDINKLCHDIEGLNKIINNNNNKSKTSKRRVFTIKSKSKSKSKSNPKTKKLKPCKENQERNPETNRCKKIKI